MLGAEVACVIRSAAARGEVADLERARNGSRALSARCCSMMETEKGGLEHKEEKRISELFGDHLRQY